MKRISDMEYIGSLARELQKIAVRAKRPLLAYLLSLVAAEAERL